MRSVAVDAVESGSYPGIDGGGMSALAGLRKELTFNALTKGGANRLQSGHLAGCSFTFAITLSALAGTLTNCCTAAVGVVPALHDCKCKNALRRARPAHGGGSGPIVGPRSPGPKV